MTIPAIPEAADAHGKVSPAVAFAAILFLLGAAEMIGPAWGYGFFLIATLLLLWGTILLLTFLLTQAFDSARLQSAFAAAFSAGSWSYVFAVCALAGYFTNEALAGRIEMKWLIFGPAALIAIIVLDWGLYRVVVQKNVATWERYRDVISRDRIEAGALQATFFDEVVIHRSLFRVSPFRWLRHQLIFWGFVLMFAVEMIAVFIREGVPAFGLADIWRMPGHPVRLAFDFAFDVTGLMILIGCILALAFRMRAQGTPDQKYTDTPTVLFLLVIVLSGFLIEGIRIAGSIGLSYHAASPVGLLFAHAFGDPTSGSKAAMDVIWTFHALAACAFIAYVPLQRLVHSCATPLGRLMNSQKNMLAAKKDRVLRGLFTRRTEL
jgi:nitrate reductase gamma subunit